MPPARPIEGIAVDNGGVLIIDQHVAHERILYEQFTERLTRQSLESERLLEPLLLALPAGGSDALAAHADDFARLGFEVEPFGGDSIRVAAVPTLLDRAECESAVRSLAKDLEGLRSRRERRGRHRAHRGWLLAWRRLSASRPGSRPYVRMGPSIAT